MRILATLSLALGLAACTSTGGPLAPVIANAPNITNDLSLACQSAEGLLALPKAVGATGKVASAVTNLDAKVTKYCSVAITGAPTIAAALGAVNTAAAVLLGLGVAL